MDEPSPASATGVPWLRWPLVMGPAVLLIALLAYGLMTQAPPSQTGDDVPDFKLAVLEHPGDAHPLAADGTITSDELKGRPVVINFWASWCIPCRDEAPILEKAWKQYGDDVMFIGINSRDSDVAAAAFVEEHGLTFPQARATDQGAEEMFGVRGMPETFFIDDEWTHVGGFAGEPSESGTQYLGPIPEDTLLEQLDLLVRRAGN